MRRGDQLRSVFLATLMVLSVVSMSGIAFTDTASASSDQFQDVNDDGSLQIWEGSVLYLRADTGNAATVIENQNTNIDPPNLPSVSANRDKLAVYDTGDVDLSFSTTLTNEFDDEDAQLIVASFEENRKTEEVASMDELTEIVELALDGDGDKLREEAKARNITFEIVDESEFDGSGAYDYTYEASQSGPYAVMLARVDDNQEQGFSVDNDGMLTLEGQATIAGIEAFAVQSGASSIDHPNKVSPGDDITVDAKTGLTDGANHSVIVYHEDTFTDTDENTTIRLTEDSIDNLSMDDVVIEHSINSTNGVSNVTEDGMLFGNNVSAQTLTGTTALSVVLESLGINSSDSDVELKSVGDTEIDASATVIPNANADENITVETFDNWTTGEYRILHLADNGTVRGFETSTSTITVEKKPPEFVVANVSVSPGKPTAGSPLTVNVTVENRGDQSGTQMVRISYDGETFEQEVTIDAGKSKKVSFTVPTGANDARDQTIAASTDDDTNATGITLSKPARFELDVIGAESDLTVPPQSDSTLTIEVENTGDIDGIQTIEAVNQTSGSVINDTSVTVAAGETKDVELTIDEANLSDTGSTEVLLRSDNDTVTQAITIDDVSIYEVDINRGDLPSEVQEGDSFYVNVTVENEGSIGGDQDLEFRLGGALLKSETVNVSAGEESDPINVSLDVPYEDSRTTFDSIGLEVSTEDDTATADLDVTRPARFTIDITDANATDLEAGDEFTPTVEVENVGDEAGDVNVTIEFGNRTVNTTNLQGLGDGTTKAIEPTIETDDNDSGTFRLVADAENLAVEEIGIDDQATEQVQMDETDVFDVTIDEGASDSDVVAGEELSVVAYVNNTGGANGTQTVELTFDGSVVDRRPIKRENGTNTTARFTYETRASDIGDGRSIGVSSEDDDDSATVDVLEPAEFEVAIESVDEEIIAGETASAVLEVRNVGGETDTETVRLFVGNDLADTATTNSLAENDRQVLTLEFVPEEAGTETITAATSDETDSVDIEVGTPGELDVDLRSVTNPAIRGDNLTATVTIENVGDGTVEGETLALDVDEGSGFTEVNSTSLPAIDGSEEITQRIRYEIPKTTEEGELPVRVRADDTADEGTTEVFDSLEDFRVEIVDAPGTVLDGENATFEVEVTNLGGGERSQDIELSVDGTVIDTNTTSPLGNDASETLELEFNTTHSAVEVGEIEYEIASEDRSVTDAITVEERTPATLVIDDVDAPDNVRQGRDLTVTVDLRNVGDDPLSDGEVTLNYSEGEEINTTGGIDLDPEGTKTVSLTVNVPEEPFAGTFERELAVETDDDSDTHTLDVDFRDIQSGVDAAADRGADEVVVGADFRQPRRTITVDTPVTISAAETANRPVIDSPQNDDTALSVEADGVELRRLVFNGTGTGTGTGVVVEKRVTMFDVDLRGWKTGIEIVGGAEHDLRRVRVSNVETGIRLAGGGDGQLTAVSVAGATKTGILVESDNNTLRGLNLRNPGADGGIRLEGNDTEIAESSLRGSQVGILPIGVRADENNPGVNLDQNNFIGLGVPMSIDGGFVEGTQNWWGFATDDDRELLRRGAVVVRSGFAGTPSQQQNDPPEYQIKNTDFPSQVTRGETLTVTADIENAGDLTGDLDAELVGDGSTIDTVSDLEIDAGDTESVEFTYTPTLADGNDIDLRIRTNDQGGNGIDDSEPARGSEKTVDILTPHEFEVTITDASPDPVEVGQTLSVDVDVENAGEAEGTETVDLSVGGSQVASQSVTLPGTETSGSNETSITLHYSPVSGDIGTDVPIEVSVPGDSDQTTVDIEAASGGGSGGGGGGGGGGGTSPPADRAPEIIDPDEIRDSIDVPADVEPNRAERATIAIDESTGQASVVFSEDSSTESITFEGDGEGLEGDVTVAEYDSEPAQTGPSPGRSVSVTQIEVPDPNRAATIRTRVSTERIEERGVDPEDLRVNRFNEDAGEWQSLPTELVETTDERVVLEAQTPGFSFFSVSATSEPEAAIDAPAEVEIDEEFTLDGSDSTDEYGEITSYEWDLDGETLTGETVTTALTEAGDYEITLTVENDAGETDTETATITVADDGEPADDGASDDGAPADDGEPDDGGAPVDEPAEFSALAIVLILIVLSVGVIYMRYRFENEGQN